MNDTPRCRTCGKVPPKLPEKTWQQWERMRYCGAECRPATVGHGRSSGWPLPDLVEELRLLAGTDAPENVCRRLGYQPGTLYRRLHRNGFDDLAAPFARVDMYQRHGWGRGS